MTIERRSRPLLGTLVEIGVADGGACEAGFDAGAEVQAALSRFEAHSEIGRFNAIAGTGSVEAGMHTVRVLAVAAELREASGGLFDISLGTAPHGWRCDGRRLHKLDPAARIDLGGIAKGYAVDCAVEALRRAGCRAGWVNAGGDLRVFGELDVPLAVRDETAGGLRAFGRLADGAFATSRYADDSGSQASVPWRVSAHVSVAAPLAIWADALTKIVAASGDASHPLLAPHGARAWIH